MFINININKFMAQSIIEFLKLVKLIEKKIEPSLPNNWNPLTFKKFILSEQIDDYYDTIISLDWDKRYLITGNGLRNIDF